MSGRLEGRTVLITGGNKGIGLGLATGVAAAGADVMIWGRDEEANAAACKELREFGGRVEAVVCDVSDPSAVVAAFRETVERLGSVHSVFANAGVSGQARPFHDHTDDEWRRTFQINLGGTVYTLREAVKHMLEHREGGALVGVASMATRMGMRLFSPYGASKAAMANLMQTLAVEYARKGIRSNAILPGYVDTNMTVESTGRYREKINQRTPVARYGVPDDFHAAAVFLADPTAIFHTGDMITIDGGYLKI